MVDAGLGHGHLVVPHAVDVVGHADRDLTDAGEHVELGQEVVGEAVDPRGVPGDHGVVPAAAPQAPGVDAHLAAGHLQVLAPLVEQLRGERPRSHARGVGLDDPERARDARRADARPHARAAGRRVRRGDERVRAVVDVEHGGLTALHEDGLATVEGLVEHERGIAHHRLEPVGEGPEVLHHLVDLDGPAVVDLDEDLVLEMQRGLDLLPQDRLVEHVLHAQPHAGDLVGVRRPDAPAGGADGLLAQEPLGDLVELLVVRRDEVRVGGDPQPRGVGAAGLEPVDLGEERLEVDDDAVADHRDRAGRQDAGGQQLELVLLAADHHGVARVVAAVGLDDVLHAAAEDVGGLTLALVAPLGADQDDRCHGRVLTSSSRARSDPRTPAIQGSRSGRQTPAASRGTGTTTSRHGPAARPRDPGPGVRVRRRVVIVEP